MISKDKVQHAIYLDREVYEQVMELTKKEGRKSFNNTIVYLVKKALTLLEEGK
jgi:predicted CopG family antitoxin